MRNVQREIREMIQTIVEKTGYDYDLIEDIFSHEFEFVSRQITKGTRGDPSTFENILLKHFGSFLSNAKYIKKLNEKNKGNKVGA